MLDLTGESGKLLELRSRTGEDETQLTEAKIGIYESKLGFARKACELGHPFDAKSVAEDLLLNAIFELLTIGPEGLSAQREATFRH